MLNKIILTKKKFCFLFLFKCTTLFGQGALNDQMYSAIVDYNFEKVRNLVGIGADVNGVNKINGFPPVYYAMPDFEILYFLLDHGANINTVVGPNNETPFLALISKGEFQERDTIKHFKLIKDCVDKYHAKVRTTNKDGQGILHIIIISSNWPISYKLKLINFFIEKGVDINSKTNSSDTPMDYSIKSVVSNSIEPNVPAIPGCQCEKLSLLHFFFNKHASYSPKNDESIFYGMMMCNDSSFDLVAPRNLQDT
jgi:hypothetical protein